MSTFEQFSEEARLYAENLPIVKAMEKEYAASLSLFFETVCSRISEIVGPRVFTQDVSKYKGRDCRYWWVQIRHGGRNEHPYVFIYADDPGIILASKAILWVSAPSATEQELASLRS